MRLGEVRRLALGVLALLLSTPSGEAWAQGASQEQKRHELQERLGIKDVPRPAATPDAGMPPSAAPAESSPPPAPGAAASPSRAPAVPPAARPPALSFSDDVLPVLVQKCGSCHRAGGMGGKSNWVIQAGLQADYDATLRFVNRAAPAQSPLLKKASGATVHAAGKVFGSDSTEFATLVRWIEGGARLGREARPSTAASTPAPRPTTPPTPKSSPAPEPAAPAAPAAPTAPAPATVESTSSAGPISFSPRVHELLLTGCAACHGPDKLASASRYVSSPDPQRHLESARALVLPGSSETSLLVQRARGEAHAAGAVWAAGSPELELLTSWVEGGAVERAEAKQAPVAAGSEAPVAAPPVPSPAGAPPGSKPHGGIAIGSHPLLGSLRLNGRFDLNYERLNYNDHPFQGEAKNALRSYHHFLFLTRQSASDPVTLTLELLSLQFWEVGYRISREAWPVQVTAKVGKLLVPFGGDPLFHHSYGGHAGFDQKVLPPVFAREGVTANVQGRWHGVSLSGDLYVIAGYGLRSAEGQLNLQSDFAPLDEARLGAGARLGASWGPLSLWYSPYLNSLGFGRRLFLQTLDLSVWRPHGIRFLEDFSFAAGLLRADVSGGEEQGYGGSGEDYYHFASYAQLRYYPLDWLYVQYRQGLRTFGNRRGVILDETRLGREDGSTHNLGVAGRWRGLSAGLYHFWNLEKADEAPDDFTRLVLAFDF
jgi:mono/diheme cytochrome c family protein